MQTKTQSLLEAVANILIGYWIATLSQLLIFPIFGIHTEFTTNMQIGALFTIVSLLRSYLLRRLFNRLHR